MSPSRRERKVVSVLFADLVGFTARSDSLDPEDVEAILSPFYGRLRTELEVRGGTVEKFIGDAVMAVFGAPSAGWSRETWSTPPPGCRTPRRSTGSSSRRRPTTRPPV